MRSCQNNLYVIYNKNKSAKVFVVQLLALGVIIIKKRKEKKDLFVLIFICNQLSFSQSIWYYCTIFNTSLVTSLC